MHRVKDLPFAVLAAYKTTRSVSPQVPRETSAGPRQWSIGPYRAPRAGRCRCSRSRAPSAAANLSGRPVRRQRSCAASTGFGQGRQASVAWCCLVVRSPPARQGHQVRSSQPALPAARAVAGLWPARARPPRPHLGSTKAGATRTVSGGALGRQRTPGAQWPAGRVVTCCEKVMLSLSCVLASSKCGSSEEVGKSSSCCTSVASKVSRSELKLTDFFSVPTAPGPARHPVSRGAQSDRVFRAETEVQSSRQKTPTRTSVLAKSNAGLTGSGVVISRGLAHLARRGGVAGIRRRRCLLRRRAVSRSSWRFQNSAAVATCLSRPCLFVDRVDRPACLEVPAAGAAVASCFCTKGAAVSDWRWQMALGS